MGMELTGERVAMLVTTAFEQVELTEPREALEDAGAEVDIVSPQKDKVKAWQSDDWGDTFDVDMELSEADPSDYDALVLPGGVKNPDKLRVNEDALNFVRHFFETGKPVAAICHGPWTLINAGVVEGRKMTSYHTLQVDLENAGAEWVNEEVVVDDGLVTSRNPDDIPAFNKAMIELFEKASHDTKAVI